MVTLAAKDSESLPENIAGHRWVCRAADCGVQSPFVRALGGGANCTARPTANAEKQDCM